MAQYICPRCFEKQDISEVEYICTNTNRNNRCSRQQEGLPFRPADIKHPVCDVCGQRLTVRVCPKCGFELPMNIESTDTYPIAIIGAKECGKRGAANPYLTLACAIGAGLEGIRKGALPPVEDTDRKALPATLLEALNSLENDAFLRNVCGESYANVYVKEKKKEWERYSREVTDWELKEYLRRV